MKLAMQRTRVRVLAALLPAAALLCAGIAHAQLVPVFDHLKCYKITDPLKVKHTLDLTPEQTQFLPEPGCVLKSPAKLFCIDVQKSNVQPTPGGPPVQGQNARDYLCYIVHCPKMNQNLVLAVEDQFGRRDITIKPPKLLCAPANKVVPPNPTPTRTPGLTPNPTPTPPPSSCGFCRDDPSTICLTQPCLTDADCPSGVICDPVNCPRNCPPCGPDPLAPQCSGDCPVTAPKCLFTGDAAMPCQCVPASQMCMTQADGTCGGLCPGLPGANMSQCGPGPTGCQCLP
jgi:hypothetical protein